MARSLSHNDSSVTSNAINQMPKYILDHSEFKSVETIKKRLNSENCAEFTKYPIEIHENQEHAIQRNISVG